MRAFRRGPRRPGRDDPGRVVLIALVSTIVFFGLVGWSIVNAPNWPAVQRAFFDPGNFKASMPALIAGFGLNVRLFMLTEVLVLSWGLVLAVLRSLPGPIFFPIRALVTVYTDVFRAVPGVLVIYLLGFGVPGLGIEGVPNDEFLWAVVALTLIYSAYVSEVYRAGIESVHPSQEAAARSLGLSRFQAMRYVVIPQAVRRVLPPLVNDFLGLQKDTVLVSFIGVIEVFKTAQIKESGNFNFTPFVAAALIFLVITVPLTRLVDWLAARDRRRFQAGMR